MEPWQATLLQVPFPAVGAGFQAAVPPAAAENTTFRTPFTCSDFPTMAPLVMGMLFPEPVAMPLWQSEQFRFLDDTWNWCLPVVGGAPWQLVQAAKEPFTVVHPESRLRDLAVAVGVTERAVQRIVAELVDGGYVRRERSGRRNRYEVRGGLPLRHPIERHRQVAELIRMVLADRR